MNSKSQASFGSKILLSMGLIIASGVYVVWQNFGGQQPVATTTTASTTQTVPQTNPIQITSTTPVAPAQPVVPVTPTPTPAPTPTPVPTPTPQPVQPTGQYVDGTYTGSAGNAYYGLVQVQAVIQGGQLADVKFLQYPSDRSTSRYINSQAMPLLTEEALQTQSAHVDGVSGATDTSQAFIQSLSSALAQAKN